MINTIKNQMSEKQWGKVEIIVVIFLTILIRIIAGFSTGGIFHPNVFEYEELARNILQGKGYIGMLNGTTYHSIMPPVYSYFNAIIYYITDYSQSMMIFTQIGISGLSSLLIVLNGRCLVKSPAPFIAGIIFSFHPALIVYSSAKIHEINLIIFFILLNIYLIFLILNNFSYWKVIGISLIFAATIFTRVTLAFFPLILFILVQGNILKKINVLFLLGIFCFSFVLMWSYRNYKIHGKFVFSTTGVYNLYMGNNIDATGTEFTEDRKSIRSIILEKNKTLYTMKETQQYDYFKERAFGFIIENPIRFIRLTIKRIYYFWWFSPYTGIEYPKYYFAFFKIYYICLLFLAFIGISDPYLYGTENQRRLLFIIFATMLSICFIQSLAYAHYRHRASIEPLLAVFSANGVSRLQRWISEILKR